MEHTHSVGLVKRLNIGRWLSAAIVGAALLLLAGIVGVADTGTVTYRGCINVYTGILRTLPNQLSAPFNDCILAGNPILAIQPKLLEIRATWNQVGPPGAPGTGATVASLAPGNINCPNGGASVTDGSGSAAFACTGVTGPQGPAGPPGPPGPAGGAFVHGFFMGAWGGPGSGDGQFNAAAGVVVDSPGNVYVADALNNRIQKFSSTGTFLSQWGSAGSGDGQFNTPVGVAVDSSGNVYVADRDNNRIQKFSSTGTFLTKWGSGGLGDGQFNTPVGVAVDSSGNAYVADTGNNRIEKFSSTGTFLTKWGSPGSGGGQLNNPQGLTVDSSGNVFVADSNNNRIEKFAG